MNAQELVQSGRLDEGLAELKETVRNNPSNSKHRIFLFQLFCVLGQWERALTQLQVLAGMDADCMLLAQIFKPVIQCEALRNAVFLGKRAPIIFGDPLPWVGLLVQANEQTAKGQYGAAQKLREEAFELAPVTAGKIDGFPFEWIADADSRLGPLLEVYVDAHYYWVPFCRINEIQIEPPTDLRNMVWESATFKWTNGGTASGFIPTRYPQSELSQDQAIQLARKTEWIEQDKECFLGLGQRIFTTDQGDYPLLDTRSICISA